MSKNQAKLIAKMRQIEIANKRRPLQESGGLTSQWGRMTSESKLLQRGHFLKNGERARLDFVREEIRRLKAQRPQKIIVVKK